MISLQQPFHVLFFQFFITDSFGVQQKEPFFDSNQNANITVLENESVLLKCVVRNKGNKTVSLNGFGTESRISFTFDLGGFVELELRISLNSIIRLIHCNFSESFAAFSVKRNFISFFRRKNVSVESKKRWTALVASTHHAPIQFHFLEKLELDLGEINFRMVAIRTFLLFIGSEILGGSNYGARTSGWEIHFKIFNLPIKNALFSLKFYKIVSTKRLTVSMHFNSLQISSESLKCFHKDVLMMALCKASFCLAWVIQNSTVHSASGGFAFTIRATS